MEMKGDQREESEWAMNEVRMSDEMSDMCGECCIDRMVIVIEEWMLLSNEWNDNGSNGW